MLNTALERRLIGVSHVLFSNHSIEGISRIIAPFFQVISSEMLTASREHQPRSTIFFQHSPVSISIPNYNTVALILALKPLNILNRISRSQKGVLPRGLLASPPSGVPKNIDIGCPESQASLARIIHSPALNGDGRSNPEPQAPVERSGGVKHLRKHGGRFDGAIERDSGAIGGDSMERFGPPLVGRNAQSGYAGEVVAEELDLLREGEERD